MSASDIDYFRNRERTARNSAERARDAAVRHAHLAMADRYAERVKAMAETPAIPLR